MDIAKSIFTKSSHDGYSTKGDTLADTLSEDEEDVYSRVSEGQDYSNEDLTPIPGGPFSALIPSMWPQEILRKLRNNQNKDPNEQPDYQFDEFGFRVEEEDGPEQNSNKLLSIPFIEDPQHKLKWLAHLEFSHNKEVGNLTWDKVETQLVKTEKLRGLLKEGVPHSIRPQVWIRLSGALQKKISADISYKDVMKASDNGKMVASKQIEKELLRILPSNACYSHSHSVGVPKLRRLLRGIAWLYPDIGYCQGIGVIAASLLLFLEEDSAFWMLGTVIEDLLPASYFSSTLIGVQADQKVLGTLISHYLPDLDNVLKEHEIELSLITLQWFLTLFAPVLHMKILLRVWDILFCEGSGVLFQITLGMLKIKEPELVKLENSAQIFNALSNLPQEITDVDNLFEESFQLCSSLNDMTIDTNRRKHLAYIMADQGAFIPNPELGTNLPKQHINKRHLKRSRSVIQTLFFGDDEVGNDMKSKNIRQTELLVDLREAILKIARHFQITDSRYNNIEILPDYSMESHAKDHEMFAKVCGTRRRRAKALLDFERHDDDELGFRKNDVITIVSQRDEHCWVGELNGLRGWFPAKFVEILDERSKQYSSAGDDAVSEAIMDLVRGTFCPAFKQILEHGMKKYAILGGICHPWLFIEESANYEVEKDFNSVYSRLVLCKTFRLDEDGKVLTPEELLYRCVQAVNQSHDGVHAQMDVKLRSLVCMGLNEQVLHLWLEVLCSCTPIVQKWYHPWSFINSPGWVQIKCELRILSRFSFNLRADYELPPRPKPPETLKEGVRDMLVKHHLFSWDL